MTEQIIQASAKVEELRVKWFAAGVIAEQARRSNGPVLEAEIAADRAMLRFQRVVNWLSVLIADEIAASQKAAR